MRKVQGSAVTLFIALLGALIGVSILTTWGLFAWIPLGEFRALFLAILTLFVFYLYALATYRFVMKRYPLKQGEIAIGSRDEFGHNLHLLFFFFIFSPLIDSYLLPVPVMRSYYLALGAKLGTETYSNGVILDPLLVEVGDHTIIGAEALIIPHELEGARLSYNPVKIGNHVTIGARAVIMAGSQIDDHAMVAVGSVVTKNTHIPAGEVWGGVPAKLLRRT